MSLIELKKISKSYKDGSENLEVLKSISLIVNKPEIVIVMGPSGSGKTTLLNIISTLDTPDNGDLLIKNDVFNYQDQSDIDSIRSRFLGILFQSNNLLPEFTILENLSIPYKLNNLDDHLNPKELLDVFQLSSKTHSFPGELSAGELQRISLLRATINKPELIVADEPTANLDKENLFIIVDFIKKIKENYDTSFIIATHDERLCDIADKILYLDNGKLVERKNNL